MIEGYPIDAVLTDDESQLVTIINGLEEQADALEGRVAKIKSTSHLLTLGSLTFLGLYFMEKAPLEKFEYSIAAGSMAIGGIERLFKEKKIIKNIRRKNRLANRLKQELESTDLERYEERDDFVFEQDDDEDDFLFT